MFNENQMVKTKWTNSTKKLYESHGYIFTKNNDELLVAVKDLPSGSNVKIKATCDYCGCDYETQYNVITNGRKIIQKDCCSNCTGRKTSEITLKKRAEKSFNAIEKMCEKYEYQLLTNIDEYIDVHTLIRFICPKHGEQSKRALGFLRGFTCVECADERIGFLQRFDSNYIKNEIEKVEGNVLLNPHEYQTITTVNLKIKCECGNVYTTSFASYTQSGTTQCRECSSKQSKSERIIKVFLEQHEVPFIQEYIFPDCRDKKPLPFDFYLPDFNMCIEFQGVQHYEPIEYFGGKEWFEYTQRHDEIKNQYCMDNNINLLRIPYWEGSNIKDIIAKELKLNL